MRTSLWQQLAKRLALFLLPVIIFACIFFLFNLNWQAFTTALIVIGALAVCLIFITITNYQREVTLAERLEATEQELREARRVSYNYQKEIETYFLLWVHQMKTPIAATQLILESPDLNTERLAIKNEMVQIENYTNMVMNYLKVNNPDTDMTVSKISLDQIINPLIKKYRYAFLDAHNRLDYEPITYEVVTEANLTSLMIEQLLSNALKYTQNGTITIHFDPNTYQLTIADTGIGIRSDDLPRIFNKGYSGQNGQLNTQSSGIGLYLVHQISQRLEQPVNVTSTLNEGTTVTLQLHRDLP